MTSSNIKFSKKVTAFTEQAVAMLSGVLRSKRATVVDVAIMRTYLARSQDSQFTIYDCGIRL